MNEALDISRLNEIFEDDREGILEVLHECSAYVRGAIEELDAAVRARDPGGVSRAAHSIKGSCANVGALACERAARAIEAQAQAGSISPDAAVTLTTLAEHFDAAIARYASGATA